MTTTTLPAPRPSRHDGFTDVAMWARDVEVGFYVNERSGMQVTARRDYTDTHGRERVALTLGDFGEADFPADTGILTCTIDEDWFGTKA